MVAIKSDSLEREAEKFLEYLGRRNYAESTMQSYRNGCNAIAEYVQENAMEQYDEDACRKFCMELLGGREYSALTNREQTMICYANRLLEFVETGAVGQKAKRPKNALNGLCAESIAGFFAMLENQFLSKSTLDSYSLYLGRFNDYLINLGAEKLSDITVDMLLGYVKSLNYQSKSVGYRTLGAVRRYLRFLYENKYLLKDYTEIIPSNKYNKNNKLPSLYTEDEISKMLNAVDRGSPKGKRDYAMMLLSTYLGLRSSDVCQLQFSEINWEQDTITIVQKKTRQRIELPLLPMIGNAIIDYLKYGRPKSESNYVFLQHIPENGCLSYSTFHSIVCGYIRHAGISTDNRRHGPHALRHSLAGRLLGAYTPMPIISEVLGHSSIESTNYYLRIDITKLCQCALNVPTTDYYAHNRGWGNE